MAWPSVSARTKNWGTEILTDSDLEAQLDLLHNYLNAALDSTTGHGHTGGTSDGPKLSIITALTIASQAQGDVIYASSAAAFARLGAGTVGQALTTGGASANPAWAGLTTQGDVEYHNGTTRTRLAAGTSGQFLKTLGAGANPAWATIIASILDYGTSASSSSAVTVPNFRIAWGTVDIAGGGTQAVTNLTFTGNTSYVVIVNLQSGGSGGSALAQPGVAYNTGAQFTITNNIAATTKTMTWIAIGS